METITISASKMAIGIALVVGLIIGWVIGFGAGGHEGRGERSCGFGNGMGRWYEQGFRNRGNVVNAKTLINATTSTDVKNEGVTPPVKPTVVTVSPTVTKQ